jgi:hypothetical protein
MSQPDATHSGFVQFPDHSSRDRFVRSALDSDPHLKQCAHLAENRPTIVFEGLTAPQRERVRSALRGLGRWYDDVQFRPTE